MICLPPQGAPPQYSSRHGPQRTQHTISTAATPRYPQGRRQTPADPPDPLSRSMLASFGGPSPRVGAKSSDPCTSPCLEKGDAGLWATCDTDRSANGLTRSIYSFIYLSIHRSIDREVNHVSIYQSINLLIYLYICLTSHLYLSISLLIYLSISIYLSIRLSIYLSIYLPIERSISIYLSIYIHLSIYISIYLYLSIYLYIYPSIHPSIDLSIYLSMCILPYLRSRRKVVAPATGVA